MSQSPPSTLGKYQIIREIARSNDIVYEAYDPVMNRRVAVKELAMPSSSTDQQKQDRIKRFMREAKAAGSLVHPNIVTVYEVSEEGGRHYLAMEYLDGETLRKKIDKDGALSPEEAVEAAIEVLKALDFAHKHGVVHRDVKPDNIQILSDGTIKLTDFGIARLTFEPNLTMDGQVFGTPSYMSPEQIHGKEIDLRSDLFSLGIVLYEMLAGEKPFTGDNVMAISHAIMNYEPPQPRAANYTLWQVLSKSLDKSPALRQDSAEEMIGELKQVLRSFSSVVADPVSAQPWNQPPSSLTQSAGTAYGGGAPVPPYGAGAYGQPPMPPHGGAPYNQTPYAPGGYSNPANNPVTPYGTPNPMYTGQPIQQGGGAPPVQGQPYNTTPYGAVQGGYGQTPYGGQVPYGAPGPGGYGSLPTGAQVPVYYPPPPRQPLFKAETRAFMGRFFVVFLILGTLVVLMVVGINAISEAAKDLPSGGAASAAGAPGAGAVSGSESGGAPVGAGAGESVSAGAEPVETGEEAAAPPFDLEGTLAEADQFVVAGEQEDMNARRRENWSQADQRYVAAMTYAPDETGRIRQRAVNAYVASAERLYQNGRTDAARQALLRAEGLAIGDSRLKQQISDYLIQIDD